MLLEEVEGHVTCSNCGCLILSSLSLSHPVKHSSVVSVSNFVFFLLQKRLEQLLQDQCRTTTEMQVGSERVKNSEDVMQLTFVGDGSKKMVLILNGAMLEVVLPSCILQWNRIKCQVQELKEWYLGWERCPV